MCLCVALNPNARLAFFFCYRRSGGEPGTSAALKQDNGCNSDHCAAPEHLIAVRNEKKEEVAMRSKHSP